MKFKLLNENYTPIEKENWEGCLIRVKPEWLDPNENPEDTYVCLEDRGDRVLVQILPQYTIMTLLPTSCWDKDWCYVYKDTSDEVTGGKIK